MPYSKIRIEDFDDALTLRIAEVNKNPSDVKGPSIWAETTPKARKSKMKRMFVSIGDYNLDTYRDSLIMPTLKNHLITNNLPQLFRNDIQVSEQKQTGKDIRSSASS